MPECPHGMSDPAWCSTCNGADLREAERESADAGTPVGEWSPPARASGSASRSRAITAQYEGRCGECGHRIEPGDLIVRNADLYAHEECV